MAGSKIKCDNDKCHLEFDSMEDKNFHAKKGVGKGKKLKNSVKLHTCQRCFFVSCTKIDFEIHVKKANCVRMNSPSSVVPKKPAKIQNSNENNIINGQADVDEDLEPPQIGKNKCL